MCIRHRHTIHHKHNDGLYFNYTLQGITSVNEDVFVYSWYGRGCYKYDNHTMYLPTESQGTVIIKYVYINVRTFNLTVLELDF
jgi:hypothetical protein